MARKTFPIADFVEKCNAMIAATADDLVESRHTVAHLVEHVLMGADTYGGFHYTDGETGAVDPSRRHYHVRTW